MKNRHGLSTLAILLAAAMLASMAAYGAEGSARFRFGTVLCAEVTSEKPVLVDLDKGEMPEITPDTEWAQLIVRLDRGRSLSIHDFSLLSGSIEYKCVAIAEEDKPFSLRDWKFEKTNMFAPYRLLFAVEKPSAGQQPDYELRFKLLSSPVADPTLHFRDMGDLAFTDPRKVPREGLLNMPLADMGLAPKPESGTNEANDAEANPDANADKKDAAAKPDDAKGKKDATAKQDATADKKDAAAKTDDAKGKKDAAKSPATKPVNPPAKDTKAPKPVEQEPPKPEVPPKKS